MERSQVHRRERLQRGRRAHGGGAISMHAAEDDARERQRRDLRGVIAGLDERRQALLPKALELRLRERRPQGDVCHDRQRSLQPRRAGR